MKQLFSLKNYCGHFFKRVTKSDPREPKPTLTSDEKNYYWPGVRSKLGYPNRCRNGIHIHFKSCCQYRLFWCAVNGNIKIWGIHISKERGGNPIKIKKGKTDGQIFLDSNGTKTGPFAGMGLSIRKKYIQMRLSIQNLCVYIQWEKKGGGG